MTISFSYAIKKLLSGQTLAWEKFNDAKAGKIILGAVKEERPWYAARIEEKSEHVFDSTMLELGYVAVCPGHRGLRLSGRIVDALLVTYGGALFATTDDTYMKYTLGNRGFKRHGVEWKGDRGFLSLWLRMPNI
jgi:hypothetical protein